MTTLPAPLPGRPAAHGEMGGSRLGWLVTDPQGAALELIYQEGHGLSICSPVEHLSLDACTAGSMEKDALDCSVEITEGWVREEFRLLGDLPDHTRDLGHEVLTGCGGMRTRQIPCTGAPVSFLPLPPTPHPHTGSAPRLGGSALRHRD